MFAVIGTLMDIGILNKINLTTADGVVNKVLKQAQSRGLSTANEIRHKERVMQFVEVNRAKTCLSKQYLVPIIRC
jgi:hypothetical protein